MEITKINRLESYVSTKQNRDKRRNECFMALKELGQATSNDVCMYLFKNGYLPFYSTIFTNPRVHELFVKGLIEPCGSKRDSMSGKKCTVYRIKEVGDIK